MNSPDDSVWWPRAQKSLPLRTLWASPWRGEGTGTIGWCIVGVDAAGGGGGGGETRALLSTQPELWKYSRVGTDKTAAPSVPQCATSSACGGAIVVSESRNARGEAA